MKKPCLIVAWTVGYGLVVLTLGCNQQPPTADTRATDEAAIHEADIAWSKAASVKELDASVSYYAEDGSVFPPHGPTATGKEAVRKVWAQMFETPGFSVSWEPVKVEAARSGDLAYSHGMYELTMNDPKGNPLPDRGKYVVVWKKQVDGSWKAVADIFNSDLPAVPPTTK